MVSWAYLLPDFLLAQEEVGAEILLGDVLIVEDGELADASEDNVLADLGGETAKRDHENRSRPHPGRRRGRLGPDQSSSRLISRVVCLPVLSLDTPEPDLSVIQGSLVLTRRQDPASALCLLPV